jgi:curved DNA-binding protein
MPRTTRRHHRAPVDYEVTLFWEDAAGKVHTSRPRARDASDGGMRVESDVSIPTETSLCVDIPLKGVLEAVVRYCVPLGAAFQVGIEFPSRSRQSPEPEESSQAKESSQSKESTQAKEPPPADATEIDHYEVMQLSPRADRDTIHRVYRIMAARFHPDNPESGSQDKFLRLQEAYRVLSDPARRAEYDITKGTNRHRPLPLFQAKAFVDEKEGEMHRRLGVLCLLYAQRRRNPDHPAVTLMELEEVMSIPRDYLEFTLWYLKQKRYVEMNQGADFCLTAAGVDFVEEHSPAQDILHRLLTGRAGAPQASQFATSAAR